VRPEADSSPEPRNPGKAADPLLAVPPPVPRTLAADHWRRLDDGHLLARQPRVNWADLLRRTWATDILSCPNCGGRMAVIDPATSQDNIRRNLDRLGLPYDPVCFAPARDPDESSTGDTRRRTGRGPPATAPSEATDPAPADGFADPPWLEDCQLPPDDEASQVPPDAEI
jgi:hypothetical protein